MRRWLLDLFFPPECVLCGKLLRDKRENPYFCLDCLYALPENDRRRELPYTEGCVAPLVYRDAVREAVHRYKFGGRSYYAPAFASLLAKKLEGTEAELVTWIPVSRRRRLERGYDQAELLARETAKRLSLACVPLLEKKHRRRQSSLSGRAQRYANIAGAFSLRKGCDPTGKRILLIDDICTTGATMTEAARVLKTAGAAQIFCGVLAVTEQ